MIMNVQQNAGAPAYAPPPPPPQAAPAPVIIKQEKSNTLCIVIATIVCLCCVIPIVIWIILASLAATAISSVASVASDLNVTVPTTTVPTTTECPSFDTVKPFMNICQPGNPVEFFVGNETWTLADFPAVMHPYISIDEEQNRFHLHPPTMFNDDCEFEDTWRGGGFIDETDCTFTVTPKNADEKIWISGYTTITMDLDPDSSESPLLFSDLTTDMTNCGDNYLSVNGARKCGYGGMEIPVAVAGPGESVELRLKMQAGEIIAPRLDGLMIYAQSSLLGSFEDAGSLNYDTDICAGKYKYTADGPGSIKSPNYPSYYPPKKYCTNQIESASDGVTFVINGFVTERNYDWLMFYDSNGEAYKLQGNDSSYYNYYDYYNDAPTFNGPQLGDRLSFSGSHVNLQFVSDYATEYSGFSISVYDGYEPANDINNYINARKVGESEKVHKKKWRKKE